MEKEKHMRIYQTGFKRLLYMLAIFIVIMGISGVNAAFAVQAKTVTGTLSSDQNKRAAAGILFTPTAVTVAEGGALAAYTVRLMSAPSDPVEIAPDSGAEVQVSPTSLQFDAGNWDAPQTLVVTAIDDNRVEGLHAELISHTVSSADVDYNNLAAANVTATIIDNDVAGVTIAPTMLAVIEGGTAVAYTVLLNSQPTDNVTITLATSGQQVSVQPPMLTFTPTSWNIPQAVIVTAVDDGIVEGNHNDTINHVASSVDADYDGIAINNVAVTVADNDAAGVSINPTTLNVSEGGAATNYALRLDSKPAANVFITLSGNGQTTYAPNPLTFTPQNWATAQMVSVTAVDDNLIEGAHNDTLNHTAFSADSAYNGIPISPVTVAIVDNDTAGVIVAPTVIAVTEGGTPAVYTVALTSRPTQNVTIDIATDDQVDTAPQVVTFTPQNWNVTKTIIVTAVNDASVEDQTFNTISHTVSSADVLYDNLAVSDVTVQVNDNDQNSVRIAPTELIIDEGGDTLAYTISLLSQPTFSVTVDIFSDGQTLMSPTAVTFMTSTWNIPQAVLVTAVDDDFYEGEHASTIGHTASSADPLFDNIAINTLPVTIHDDDTAEVLINPTSLTISEGGDGSSYALNLSSQPLQPVTVTITNTGQISSSLTTLAFDAVNWSVPQSVTVTAVDDSDIEGDHASTLFHTSSSADENFNTIPISPTLVTIIDNDTAGVLIAPTTLNVSEGGPPTTYTVSLTGQPTQTVTITLNITDGIPISSHLPITNQIAISPTMLVFDTENWDSSQAVAVSKADNDYVNQTTSVLISHTLTSTDTSFAALTPADVLVNILDDEIAGAIVAPAAITLTEGGPAVTYTLRLTSQPMMDVVITPTHDAQTAVSPATLTFTPENWAETQTLIVSAVDDDLIEGAHTGTVTHAASSADPDYDGIAISSVIATITDDDFVGVSFEPDLLHLDEGGASGSYSIRLTHQPEATVTIHVLTDLAQIQFDFVNEVVFTPGNWDSGQLVTVTAVDNNLSDGSRAVLLNHIATSADPNYDDLAIASVVVVIHDDEPSHAVYLPIIR